jgi:hypothetical protein
MIRAVNLHHVSSSLSAASECQLDRPSGKSYSVLAEGIPMCAAKRKNKARTADSVVRAAAILERHFSTLSKPKEKKARRDLHKLATAVSRRARGKVSRAAQTPQSHQVVRAPLGI